MEKTTQAFYDLAIIDLNLPDMNGRKVYDMIRARSPKTKTIILTGLPPIRSGKDADSESIDYLSKPISAEELLNAVKEKLSGPKP